MGWRLGVEIHSLSSSCFSSSLLFVPLRALPGIRGGVAAIAENTALSVPHPFEVVGSELVHLTLYLRARN
eukprot:m.473908 g.473908  ORF g.473908 m.473908 type:complete len:70 (+) comp35203_c0_seq1:9-218(+)